MRVARLSCVCSAWPSVFRLPPGYCHQYAAPNLVAIHRHHLSHLVKSPSLSLYLTHTFNTHLAKSARSISKLIGPEKSTQPPFTKSPKNTQNSILAINTQSLTFSSQPNLILPIRTYITRSDFRPILNPPQNLDQLDQPVFASKVLCIDPKVAPKVSKVPFAKDNRKSARRFPLCSSSCRNHVLFPVQLHHGFPLSALTAPGESSDTSTVASCAATFYPSKVNRMIMQLA